jgi:hypothetical protein
MNHTGPFRTFDFFDRNVRQIPLVAAKMIMTWCSTFTGAYWAVSDLHQNGAVIQPVPGVLIQIGTKLGEAGELSVLSQLSFTLLDTCSSP